MPGGIDNLADVLQIHATMKRATVRQLRNHYSDLLRDVEAGEEVLITRRGVPVARLCPVGEMMDQPVDWSRAPEVLRDRSGEMRLSKSEVARVLSESSGSW